MKGSVTDPNKATPEETPNSFNVGESNIVGTRKTMLDSINIESSDELPFPNSDIRTENKPMSNRVRHFGKVNMVVFKASSDKTPAVVHDLPLPDSVTGVEIRMPPSSQGMVRLIMDEDTMEVSLNEEQLLSVLQVLLQTTFGEVGMCSAKTAI